VRGSAKVDLPATYDDILALPEGILGQIIDGVLYTSPRPAGKHAYAATKISSSIDPSFGSRSGGGPGGWVFLFEPAMYETLLLSQMYSIGGAVRADR
jgi:hypothetical protein